MHKHLQLLLEPCDQRCIPVAAHDYVSLSVYPEPVPDLATQRMDGAQDGQRGGHLIAIYLVYRICPSLVLTFFFARPYG